MTDSASNKPKKAPWQGYLILGILALIIVIVMIRLIHVSGSHTKAAYTASVDTNNMVVVNPATLAVSFKVTNTGTTSGQPWCTLNANDASSMYSGSDYFQLSSSLKPGETSTSVDNLTISKQGAQYVKSANISCH